MRRIRATFLLRCVILAACAGAFLLVLQLGNAGWAFGFFVALVGFWFLCVEGGLLPYLIERIVVRRAARKDGPVSSLWFVDVDEERRLEDERFREDTKDNPTIR